MLRSSIQENPILIFNTIRSRDKDAETQINHRASDWSDKAGLPDAAGTSFGRIGEFTNTKLNNYAWNWRKL
jgi:hypothetical protein